jgi:hypothetical protein
MKKMTSAVVDGAADILDKCATATTRAGHVVERVAKLTRGGISPAVTALQMTETDPAGQTFTVADIESYGKLFRSVESGTPLTAKQTTALLKDAKVHARGRGAQKSTDLGDAGDAVPAGI